MNTTLFCSPNITTAQSDLKAFAGDYPEAICSESSLELRWPMAKWIFRVVNTLEDARRHAGHQFSRINPHGKMTYEAFQFLKNLERS